MENGFYRNADMGNEERKNKSWTCVLAREITDAEKSILSPIIR